MQIKVPQKTKNQIVRCYATKPNGHKVAELFKVNEQGWVQWAGHTWPSNCFYTNDDIQRMSCFVISQSPTGELYALPNGTGYEIPENVLKTLDNLIYECAVPV